MPYGFQIRTNQGLTDVANINVGRYVAESSQTASSGSITVNAFDDSNGLGHITIITNDNKIPPRISWNNSTKVLSWDRPTYSTLITSGMYSSNFKFVFWRFD